MIHEHLPDKQGHLGLLPEPCNPTQGFYKLWGGLVGWGGDVWWPKILVSAPVPLELILLGLTGLGTGLDNYKGT